MKRILQVVSCLEKGGTEAFLMNSYRHIDKTRFYFDFLVLSRDNSPYEEEIIKLGGRVIYAKINLSALRFFSAVSSLRRVIESNGPYDIVHSHIDLANSLVLTAAKEAGVKVRVSHSHNTNFFKGNWFNVVVNRIRQYFILKNATVLCACGEEAGRDLYGQNSEYMVIKNGIDVDAFLDISETQKAKLKSSFGFTENDIVFTNVTRFSPQKNLPFVIDVFSCIVKSLPNAILIIGGQDGDERQIVIQKIKEYGISDRVRLVGVRNDIPIILSISDFSIFPSRHEGLSFALLEKQAAGVNIITSTSVSAESDLGLDLMMFLPLSDNAEAWAQSILRIRRKKLDKDIIRSIFIQKGYNIHDSVKKIEYIYEK